MEGVEGGGGEQKIKLKKCSGKINHIHVVLESIPPPQLGYFGSHFIFTSRKNWMNSEWESIILIGILLVYASLHIWNRVGKEKQKSGKGWIRPTRQNQGVWKAHVVWFLKLQRKLALRKESVPQKALPPRTSCAQKRSCALREATPQPPPRATFCDCVGCSPPLQAPGKLHRGGKVILLQPAP